MTGADAGVRPTEMQYIEDLDPGVVEGTELQVLKYPHPLLRKPNAEIPAEEIEHEAKRIAKEMLAIMYASKGVGLAAPQFGINKRLMVFNPQGDAKAWLQEVVLVNPRIVSKSKSSDVELEGCLSFPGMNGHVRRHEWVKVEATRLNGKKFKIKYEGWAARIFQHEYDHLDGVLYIDRLEHEDREQVKARLQELVDNYRTASYYGMDPAL
jgi:peptide deformylase